MSKKSVSPKSLSKAIQGLGAWFERQKRVLPWRDEPTLYRVWISEIMLQQTQVATVVPYFERFLSRFPTVESLASAPVEDVLHAWAGLGYYSRARNLHRAAQQIVARGDFPRDREGWLEVPGVGNYTAGAILSIALNQPEAILDGNVERVLSRVRRVGRVRGDAVYKERLWRLARIFVQSGAALDVRPSVTNQALMELGATICTPKKPKCERCPVAEICRARQLGQMEAYPPRKKPKEWLSVAEELHCVLDPEGRVWLRKRTTGEWRAGLWDLPEAAPTDGAEFLGEIQTRYVVTRHKVVRTTRIWRLKPGEWQAAQPAHPDQVGTEHAWISPVDPQVAIGSALKRTLRQVHDLVTGLDSPSRQSSFF